MSATKSKLQTGLLLNGKPFSERFSSAKPDLIYLGSEFCPNLLPGPGEFRRAERAFGKPVVLVTPFLTDVLLGGVEAVLRARGREEERLEVVANDLGLIRLIARRYAARTRPALGRILSDFLRPAPDAFLRGFLSENGITRIEVDTPELLARYARLGGLSCTYHIPFSHMAVTRFCPWERHWVGERCRYACLGKCRKLDEKRLRRPLHLMNCGYFAAGGDLPRNARMDRVVYSPAVSA